MPPTALIIGLPGTCRRLQRQLELLDQQPITLGWVLLEPPHDPHDLAEADAPILGTADELESIVARRRPALALITLPAVMASCITSIRTRLRRLGIPDRFMPTLEDQIAGVGPRTQIDIDTTALLQRPVRRIDEVAVRTLLAGQRILITGAGGSIGSELSRIVARYGPAHLTLVDRSENALFEIDRQIARWFPRLPRTALLHDVVEEAETRNHFRRLRPHLVFHAAAHKHVPMMEDHPAAAVDNNFFGTRSVADAADAAGVDRMIMISTDKAVNPSSIMGATKRLAELYVQHINRRSGTGFAMVRFGNVLGSAGSVLESWSRQIAEGGPLTITHPEMTRYFMSIPEAAALVIQAASLLGATARRPRRRARSSCWTWGSRSRSSTLPGGSSPCTGCIPGSRAKRAAMIPRGSASSLQDHAPGRSCTSASYSNTNGFAPQLTPTSTSASFPPLLTDISRACWRPSTRRLGSATPLPWPKPFDG